MYNDTLYVLYLYRGYTENCILCVLYYIGMCVCVCVMSFHIKRNAFSTERCIIFNANDQRIALCRKNGTVQHISFALPLFDYIYARWMVWMPIASYPYTLNIYSTCFSWNATSTWNQLPESTLQYDRSFQLTNTSDLGRHSAIMSEMIRWLAISAEILLLHLLRRLCKRQMWEFFLFRLSVFSL